MRMPRMSGAVRSAAAKSIAGAASVAGSRRSWPAIAAVSRATSSTLCAIGPSESSVVANGKTPARLIRPYVGLSPVRPHSADGMRIEPPVSEPIAAGASPAATATAEPLLEPPATRCTLSIPWIPRRTHRHVATPATERKFHQVRLAERDHPRGLQAFPRKRRFVSDAERPIPRTRRRHSTAQVDEVLEGDRQPVQGSANLSCGALLIGLQCGETRVVAVDVDERMQALVERSNAVEASVDDLTRRYRARSEQVRQFGDRQPGQIVHGARVAGPVLSRRAASA